MKIDLVKPPAKLLKLSGLLKKAKYRRQEQLSIAEGDKLIGEALAAGIPLHSAFFTKNAVDEHNHLLSKLQTTGIKVYHLSPSEMERMSPLKSPPGCLAIYRTDFAPIAKGGDLALGLYGISDPGNLGAILRSADWFGVSKVYLSESCAELHNPTAVRGSMGAVFRLSVETGVNLIDRIPELKKEGWRIITSITRGGECPRNIPGKKLLVMCDEQGRLPEEIDTLTDARFTIPRFGGGESLNVGAACGIILYALNKITEKSR